MNQVTSGSRAKVFELYTNGLSQNDIERHTKLSSDYIDNLIRGWEIDKAREKLRIIHENKIDAKPRILIDRPQEVNFVLLPSNSNKDKVMEAYNRMVNPIKTKN
jgi:hypothetical protein